MSPTEQQFAIQTGFDAERWLTNAHGWSDNPSDPAIQRYDSHDEALAFLAKRPCARCLCAASPIIVPYPPEP